MSRPVLLAGEGPDELGRWYRELPYQHLGPKDVDVPGLLEALLHKLEVAPWTVVGGAAWRRIPVYRAGNRRAPETKRVLGLALLAGEQGAEVVVFARDRDRDVEREADIEAGITEARALGLKAALAGAVAVEEIEAWLLAMLGDRGAERCAQPKEKLAEQHGADCRARKVAIVEEADVERAAQVSPSLARFCERVRGALGDPAGSAPIPTR